MRKVVSGVWARIGHGRGGNGAPVSLHGVVVEAPPELIARVRGGVASDAERRRWLALRDAPRSKAQINKAGDRIRRARGRSEHPAEEDLRLLDEFRAGHYPTLRQVHETLARLLHKRMELDPARFRVTARPLKTPEAIMAKLVRERTRLATMQDIAATRVVVPTLDDQERVTATVLERFKHCHASIAKDSREEGNGTAIARCTSSSR